MGFMDRWLLTTENDCEPGREAEFHDWWETVHVKDVLAAPGYRRGRRFQAKEQRDGRGRNLMLFEVESDDIVETLRIRDARRKAEAAQGRHPHGLIHPIWRNVPWKPIGEQLAPGNGVGAQLWINMTENKCDPRREEEYAEWYDAIHVPDVLSTPGFVSARRYKAKDLRDGRGMYLAIYEILTDDIEATLRLRRARREAEAKAGRGVASRGTLARPVWRDVLWRQVADYRNA